MQQGARVESIDALARFRLALVKFRETAIAALGDAEGDIQRTLNWVENDQESFWMSQIRLRRDALGQARDSLRQKTIFKDSTGRPPSAVEEQKAVARAQQRLEEAQQKLAAVRHWGKFLQREVLLYRGQVQRFVTNVSSDVPAAIAQLGGLIAQLNEYVALAPDAAGAGGAAAREYSVAGGVASMTRGQAPVVEQQQRPYVHLRSRAPKPEARAAAMEAQRIPSAWMAGQFNGQAAAGIASLSVDWTALNPADRVVIAAGAEGSPRIFLDHSAGAAGDSGWYIAPVEEGEVRLEWLAVADLLSVRPDWRQLLSLPAGCLAVIDRGGIVAVLNDHDENLWSVNSGPCQQVVP
jgi:hypothetical protein